MKVNGRAFARQWMGRIVRATHEVRGHEARKLGKPIVGWVVGYAYRRRGKTVFEDGAGYVFENSGPGTPVVLVCPWPGRRPVDVPFDCIELTEQSPALAEWREENKSEMRAIMKDHPRGPDGRWLRP